MLNATVSYNSPASPEATQQGKKRGASFSESPNKRTALDGQSRANQPQEEVLPEGDEKRKLKKPMNAFIMYSVATRPEVRARLEKQGMIPTRRQNSAACKWRDFSPIIAVAY